MPVRIVQLGTPRHPHEGARLGTVRRPPRGVPREEFGSRDYYDAWLPELSPSAELVTWAMSTPWTEARWRQFSRRFRAEMREPHVRHLLETLAILSRQTSFSVGCYCDDEAWCHRSILRELLAEAGATFAL